MRDLFASVTLTVHVCGATSPCHTFARCLSLDLPHPLRLFADAMRGHLVRAARLFHNGTRRAPTHRRCQPKHMAGTHPALMVARRVTAAPSDRSVDARALRHEGPRRKRSTL